jgi:hypothetical protein
MVHIIYLFFFCSFGYSSAIVELVDLQDSAPPVSTSPMLIESPSPRSQQPPQTPPKVQACTRCPEPYLQETIFQLFLCLYISLQVILDDEDDTIINNHPSNCPICLQKNNHPDDACNLCICYNHHKNSNKVLIGFIDTLNTIYYLKEAFPTTAVIDTLYEIFYFISNFSNPFDDSSFIKKENIQKAQFPETIILNAPIKLNQEKINQAIPWLLEQNRTMFYQLLDIFYFYPHIPTQYKGNIDDIGPCINEATQILTPIFNNPKQKEKLLYYGSQQRIDTNLTIEKVKSVLEQAKLFPKDMRRLVPVYAIYKKFNEKFLSTRWYKAYQKNRLLLYTAHYFEHIQIHYEHFISIINYLCNRADLKGQEFYDEIYIKMFNKL